MKSVYMKNFLFTAGMILVSFLIFGVTFTMIFRNYTISEKREALHKSAEILVEHYEEHLLMQPADLSDMDTKKYAYSMAMFSGGSHHAIITDEVGFVVNCSDDVNMCLDLDKEISQSILTEISITGEYYGIGTLNGIYDSQHYVVGLPVTAMTAMYNPTEPAEILGYVFVSTDVSTVMNTWSSFAALFTLTGMGVLFLATILSIATAARQTAPLKEMANAAGKFAHGDFSVRVTDRGRIDEIGELTAAFNAMANSLEKSENLRREFVANVSHELKTPMTSITGFADGIMDGTIPPEEEKKYLEIIASETKRLSRLVRNMLDSSQIQNMDPSEIKKESFNINEVLLRTLVSLESKINERGLDVDADLPEQVLMVKGKEDSITQVVYNLLDNAIKFSHKGTTIGLVLRREGKKVKVTVRNTGESISKEDLPLIFDRFHKTDKSRGLDKEGVGLGLHIVRTIINTHGEDIYVTSENGVTEFTFTLTPQ